MGSTVITPEDVLESLMNDGTKDATRLKIINQLKAIRRLPNAISPVLLSDGGSKRDEGKRVAMAAPTTRRLVRSEKIRVTSIYVSSVSLLADVGCQLGGGRRCRGCPKRRQPAWSVPEPGGMPFSLSQYFDRRIINTQF